MKDGTREEEPENLIPAAQDRYVRVRFHEIVDEVCRRHFPEDGDRLRRLAWLLENLVEFRMGEVEESIKEAYLPFCPDDDTVTRRPHSPEEIEERRARFWTEFGALLEKANFEKIERDEFEKAVRAGTTRGLRVDVDLDQYAEFALYFRGRGETVRTVRAVKTRFLKTDVPVPIYLRAVIATRMKGETHIQLRLFKEIPQRDIESLLPGTKLRMRILDKLKLTGTGGAAVYSAFRMALQGAILVGKAFLLPLVFAAGFAYLGRTALRFFKIRDEYRKNLIRDLYFQSLDSNLGVINRIVDSTEEEECKEAFLAHALLLARGPCPSKEDLRAEISRFLLEGWGIEPAFDLEDALEKMAEFELVRESDGRLEAAPLPEALALLDARWDSLYDAGGEL